MLFRRFVFGVLIRVARNPEVQKKAGDLAGKALEQARPSLLRASKNAGVLARRVKHKLFDNKNLDGKNN